MRSSWAMYSLAMAGLWIAQNAGSRYGSREWGINSTFANAHTPSVLGAACNVDGEQIRRNTLDDTQTGRHVL
jgi:hypothetical protein